MDIDDFSDMTYAIIRQAAQVSDTLKAQLDVEQARRSPDHSADASIKMTGTGRIPEKCIVHRCCNRSRSYLG